MGRILSNLAKAITALLCAMVLVLAPGAGAEAAAQTISNTAQALWSQEGRDFSARSNTVAFQVLRQSAVIDTFVPVPNSGQPFAFNPSSCGGQTIAIPGGLGVGDHVASLERTGTLRVGDILFFRLIAPAANTNPAAVDSIQATLTTTSGDRETITVMETATNSGIFVGAVPSTAIPPQPVQGDCRLSVAAGDVVSIESGRNGGSGPLATAQVEILADPYGIVFDSEDGTPIDGARISLVDALTGAPARVFGDDGLTTWPSSMISGQPVTDGAGNVWRMLPGEYRFPLAPLGQYRLVVETPAPYSVPSQVQPAGLAALRRPDGGPLAIGDASYGRSFTLNSPAPVRVDIPADRPSISVGLTKTVSRPSALPGDVVFYTVTARNGDPARTKRDVVLVDRAARSLRLRSDTVMVDGVRVPDAVQPGSDGSSLTIRLGDIAPGASRTVTYAMTVRADAAPGQAVNRATATDARGNVAVASATVRIQADPLAGRMTLIGRITDGGCSATGERVGIPGVRVMLEDGSFAITDAEGRYHFEGLTPGTHVAQALSNTLPKGGEFFDCSASTRSAGSPSSKFVIGQGGSLVVADFFAILPEKIDANIESKTETLAKGDPAASDKAAAGGETNWLAMGDGPDGFLFPATDHNPRAPAVRVVIRHRAAQKVDLAVDGKPADAMAFDGTRKSANNRFAVSIWRGIALGGETTRLVAMVRNADGSVAATHERAVHYARTPARVELVPERSRLVADGTTRPVVALRVLDRQGRPVHSGIAGEFRLSAPYESAEGIDAMQARALSGLGRAAPRWMVEGDDGIALVELAPTMVSGKLHMEFVFADDNQRRRQELDAWVVPGEQPWTLVGLAEGSAGAKSVARNMERSGRFDSDLGNNGRVAFYAKGRVLGRYLLTIAYDSAKQRDDQRLLGAIDPNAYYTVFADGSDRRFDAASRRKLYVRIESAAFYALFGDFDTGFVQTQLARYQRITTGVKAEVNSGGFHAQGFAAKVGSTHRRDEFQGGGISGPYRLSSRALIANSETVRLEVRDRFRSEVIIDSRTLTRFTDYDIDLLAGTITFREPILSRDAALNPQFIVIDYEIDGTAGGRLNAGLRGDWTSKDGRLRLGATALTDTSGVAGAGDRTDLGGVDLRARLSEATEIRAEAAISRAAGASSTAWLVEAEHHDGKLDLLAYARSAGQDFGVGQMSGAERGRRKVGLDARYNVTEALALTTSAWHDDSLVDGANRTAVQAGATYRTGSTDGRLGIAMMRDRLADGRSASSTLLEGAVTRRLFDNKLELGAASSISLGKAESIDLPARHRFNARYALTPAVKLVGAYEIADGRFIDARTARGGLEVTPWTGGRIVSSLGQQQISEYGKRSFAAFGLAQALEVSKSITVDATFEDSRTIGGFDATRLINPAHPASSGGQLGEAGTIAEDFTAATLGATWRRDRWTATMRGEWRDGQLADRKGVTAGLIRQLGEGSMVGTGFTFTRAKDKAGASSEVFDGAIAIAHRPASSAIAFLAKAEFRADRVTNAVAGEAGPAGRTALTVNGDARSRRIIGSLSANWSPDDRVGEDGNERIVQRNEVGLFAAVRHNFDRFQGFDLAGTTLLGGLDARIGIGDRIEIGGVATVRASLADGTTSFAVGPQIGFVPARDTLLVVGYNITGFRDRDFAAARNTDKGLFATLRMKFDADTLGFLGLNR